MVSCELEEKTEEVGDEGRELERLKESVKVELDGGVDVNFGDVAAGFASMSSGASLEVVDPNCDNILSVLYSLAIHKL